MKKVLEEVEIPTESMRALLVFIPKEEKPSDIKCFIPISHCIAIIKLAIKLIVNRLKEIRRSIIAQNQVLFVHRRQSIDYIVVCQELVHSLRYTMARGGMVLKLDLEKACDRTEWSYIKDTLEDAALPKKIIMVIMSIIAKSSCRLLWNDKITNCIKPTRVLRHCYLLSFSPSVWKD